jgi:hypothetical protein
MSDDPPPHRFERVVPRGRRYTLFCSCGWESPSFELAQLVGEAWDRHLARAAEPED